MNFLTIIAYAGYVIWFFPLYKQYGTKYFNFALMNAIAGPAMFLIQYYLRIPINQLFPGFYLFSLGTIVFSNKKYVVFSLALIALLFFSIIRPSTAWVFKVTLIIDFVMFIIILLAILELLTRKQVLNMFLILLFIYLSIDIVKLFDIAIDLGDSYLFYYMGETAQLVFAISFVFINYDTKNIKLKLKSLEEIDIK